MNLLNYLKEVLRLIPEIYNNREKPHDTISCNDVISLHFYYKKMWFMTISQHYKTNNYITYITKNNDYRSIKMRFGIEDYFYSIEDINITDNLSADDIFQLTLIEPLVAYTDEFKYLRENIQDGTSLVEIKEYIPFELYEAILEYIK